MLALLLSLKPLLIFLLAFPFLGIYGYYLNHLAKSDKFKVRGKNDNNASFPSILFYLLSMFYFLILLVYLFNTFWVASVSMVITLFMILLSLALVFSQNAKKDDRSILTTTKEVILFSLILTKTKEVILFSLIVALFVSSFLYIMQFLSFSFDLDYLFPIAGGSLFLGSLFFALEGKVHLYFEKKYLNKKTIEKIKKYDEQKMMQKNIILSLMPSELLFYFNDKEFSTYCPSLNFEYDNLFMRANLEKMYIVSTIDGVTTRFDFDRPEHLLVIAESDKKSKRYELLYSEIKAKDYLFLTEYLKNLIPIAKEKYQLYQEQLVAKEGEIEKKRQEDKALDLNEIVALQQKKLKEAKLKEVMECLESLGASEEAKELEKTFEKISSLSS